MPIKIKVFICILAVALCTAVFMLDTREDEIARWIALALGPLMVLAVWIFPEPTKDREIRKEAAARR